MGSTSSLLHRHAGSPKRTVKTDKADGPFVPQAVSAEILSKLSTEARARYTSLSALLKATPVTALLEAQQQKLITLHTNTPEGKSLRRCFQKLIDAEIMSAPVYDDNTNEWIGFLDSRDLIQLLLLRYLWRSQSATAPISSIVAAPDATEAVRSETPATGPSPVATVETEAVSKAKKSEIASRPIGADQINVVGLHVSDFIDDALTAALGSRAGADTNAPSTGNAVGGAISVDMDVRIDLISLAKRYPWRPLSASATVFDVAKELLTDVRRVPIVAAGSSKHKHLLGVVTQSAIISFLSSKMTEIIPNKGIAIHGPAFTGNAVANAVATAEESKRKTKAGIVHGLASMPSPKSDTIAGVGVCLTAAEIAPNLMGHNTGSEELRRLELVESGRSAWQLPLTQLGQSLPLAISVGDSKSGGESNSTNPLTAASIDLIGTSPVWTIASDTPLADAIWSMSQASASSAVVCNTAAGGEILATLSVADLNLLLRMLSQPKPQQQHTPQQLSQTPQQNGKVSDGVNSTGPITSRPVPKVSPAKSIDTKTVHFSVGADFIDRLMEGDVIHFIRTVQRTNTYDNARISSVRNRTPVLSVDRESTKTLVPTVGTGASLAQILHRLAALRAHKCYVVASTPPFIPLRVISLTDVLMYVVATDADSTITDKTNVSGSGGATAIALPTALKSITNPNATITPVPLTNPLPLDTASPRTPTPKPTPTTSLNTASESASTLSASGIEWTEALKWTSPFAINASPYSDAI